MGWGPSIIFRRPRRKKKRGKKKEASGWPLILGSVSLSKKKRRKRGSGPSNHGPAPDGPLPFRHRKKKKGRGKGGGKKRERGGKESLPRGQIPLNPSRICSVTMRASWGVEGGRGETTGREKGEGTSTKRPTLLTRPGHIRKGPKK